MRRPTYQTNHTRGVWHPNKFCSPDGSTRSTRSIQDYLAFKIFFRINFFCTRSLKSINIQLRITLTTTDLSPEDRAIVWLSSLQQQQHKFNLHAPCPRKSHIHPPPMYSWPHYFPLKSRIWQSSTCKMCWWQYNPWHWAPINKISRKLSVPLMDNEHKDTQHYAKAITPKKKSHGKLLPAEDEN